MSTHSQAPYALAISAGLLAALNPCGFAMLPGFLSLIVTDADGNRRAGPAALGRALAAAAVMTTGFVTVFAVFAAAIAPAAMWIQQYLPWATLGIGVSLTTLGALMALGREFRLPARLTWHSKPRPGPLGLPGMFGYGVGYALASLSCTAGPFLALTSATLRSGDLAGAGGVFAAYAAGMGLVVAVAAVAVAMARDGMVARLRSGRRHVGRAGGIVLMLAGGYLAYYGWVELGQMSGNAGEDPMLRFASGIQAAMTSWLAGLGPGPVLAALLVLVGAGWAGYALRRRSSSAPDVLATEVPVPASAEPAPYGTSR